MSKAAGKTMNLVKRYTAQSNKILGKELHKIHYKKFKKKKEQRESERERRIYKTKYQAFEGAYNYKTFQKRIHIFKTYITDTKWITFSFSSSSLS